jgi:hypothetical protein
MTQFEMNHIAKERIAHLTQEAERTRDIKRYTACEQQASKEKSLVQKLWQLLTLGLVLLLAACSTTQPSTPSEEANNDALFSDADFEGVALDLATWTQLEPQEEIVERLEPAIQTSNLITANAVGHPSEQQGISGARGLQYFIERNASTQPWRIVQTEQWKGVNARKTIYQGNREIQSVSADPNGTTLLVSMRETSSSSSDFEIYQLSVATLRITQLTNNALDDINVSMAASPTNVGFSTAWQGNNPATSRQSVFVRQGLSAFILTNSFAYIEPSFSQNGRYIALIDTSAPSYRVVRFDTLTTTFQVIHTAVSSGSTAHPSVSDDGRKIVWLEHGTPNRTPDRIRMKQGDTITDLVEGATLNHPHLSRDGRFIIFEEKLSTNIRIRIMSLETLRIANIQSNVGLDYLAPVWVRKSPFQEQLFDNDGSQAYALYGSALAYDRNTLLVGAPSKSSFGRDARSGSVYIYERTVSGVSEWRFMKEINPRHPLNGTEFGAAVDIHGDTLVVGEPELGVVEVYERNLGGTNNWGFRTVVRTSDVERGTKFGHSVAIHGDTIVVGDISTPFIRTGEPELFEGAVYIFERNQGGANQWGEVKKRVASDKKRGAFYGWDVDIVGNTIVVGAPQDDNEKGADAGAVYVLQRNAGGDNNWGEVRKIVPDDLTRTDFFGSSVAVNGEFIVAGAPQLFDENVGSAYVYRRDSGTLQKKLSSFGSLRFGSDVAIRGSTVVVGEPQDNARTGKVHIFEKDKSGTNQWGIIRDVLPSGSVAGERFGSAVAIGEGDTLIVGSPHSSDNGFISGSVYFFE